jgi:hypothetical protein
MIAGVNARGPADRLKLVKCTERRLSEQGLFFMEGNLKVYHYDVIAYGKAIRVLRQEKLGIDQCIERGDCGFGSHVFSEGEGSRPRGI